VADDLLARFDGFFGGLQPLHQEGDHLLFIFWLRSLLHDCKLALQVHEILIVFLRLLLHVSLAGLGSSLLTGG